MDGLCSSAEITKNAALPDWCRRTQEAKQASSRLERSQNLQPHLHPRFPRTCGKLWGHLPTRAGQSGGPSSTNWFDCPASILSGALALQLVQKPHVKYHDEAGLCDALLLCSCRAASEALVSLAEQLQAGAQLHCGVLPAAGTSDCSSSSSSSIQSALPPTDYSVSCIPGWSKQSPGSAPDAAAPG